MNFRFGACRRGRGEGGTFCPVYVSREMLETKLRKAENSFSGEKQTSPSKYLGSNGNTLLQPFPAGVSQTRRRQDINADNSVTPSYLAPQEALELPLITFSCPHRRLY